MTTATRPVPRESARVARSIATSLLVGALAFGQDPSGAPRPTRSAPPFGAAERTDETAKFQSALERRDDEAAAASLTAALHAAEDATDVLRSTYAVAESFGRLDLWAEGAARFSDETPDHPFAAYLAGWTYQRLKHLRRAEPYLLRAVSAAPDVGAYRSSYAWNAFLRFDKPEALRRASEGAFDDKGALVAAASARAEGPPRPWGRAAALLVVYGIAAFALVRTRAASSSRPAA